MELEQLVVPKEKIEEELQAFKQLLRSHKRQLLTDLHRDLARIYGHMRHKGKVIDIYSSFKKAGLNKNRNPKLAICRADASMCYCYKGWSGSAIYSKDSGITKVRKSHGDIRFPEGTFQWMKDEGEKWIPWSKAFIQTPVPYIPTKVLSKLRYTLKNYHIIWEVEKWARVPPKDPILVKMVTPNIALVLATWELTELERAVIMGRL